MEGLTDTGYDQALAQHQRLGIPTVVIPVVLPNGDRALYWESFLGLPERITTSETLQSMMAAVCCEAAYENAFSEFGATPVYAET